MLCRVQEGGVAMGADVLQRLLVLAVFVAGVVEKGMDGLAGLVPAIIYLIIQHFDLGRKRTKPCTYSRIIL